jgi:PAS domain S-box-containing protein
MDKTKVIIIDENVSIKHELHAKLTNLAYQVDNSTQPEALDHIQKNRPDIVLIDVNPDDTTNGMQVAEKIRNLYQLPIIYILPEIESGVLQNLNTTQPDGILFRPFNNQLYSTLELARYHHQVLVKLNQSQSQNNAILRSIKDGVVAIDRQARVLFMNPVAIDLTGWQEHEAIGQSIDEIIKIIDQGTLQPILLTNMVRVFYETRPLADFDVVLSSKNGRQIPVFITIAPLRSQVGDPQGVVIGIRDTTELHRSYQQILLQARRSDTLLRILSTINASLDLDKLLSSLLEETNNLLGADGSAAFLATEDETIYRIVSTFTVHEKLRKIKSDGFEIVARIFDLLLPAGQSISSYTNIQDQIQLPFREFLVREDIRSTVIVNLHRNNQVFGALVIVNVGRSQQYTQDDLQLIKGLADQASDAIVNARLYEQVQASRNRLQALSKRLVEVQEAERRSLARELHDQVGQMLTGLQFLLELGKRKASGDLKGVLEDSQGMVSDLMKQIRDLSMRLLPAMLEDLGLQPTLTWMFDNYSRQTGIQVHFSQSNLDKRLPSYLEMTAYRIVQESLTNVARYAHTDEAYINLDLHEDELHIKIQDHGIGFEQEKVISGSAAFGLTSMRERAYLAGGQLTIKSAPGNGTEIIAILPLKSIMERRKYDR